MVDFTKIQEKWRKKWEASKIFESRPESGKKFFTSGVIPYVNGSPHIGHSYTYTRTDVYARFKRMQGFNTLFAQGWHATGEPIVGTIERLKANDQVQISTFKSSGATDKDLEDFKKNGPAYVAKFWSKRWEQDWRSMGFSIDWRRTFTLSVDPGFSKFVEWQYNTLKEKGYVVQGTHPVVWCPRDQSPTGDHDRLRGEGESPIEYTLLKFDLDGVMLPAATLRPETVYGATNLWLEPNAEYVEIETSGEKWIVSKAAVEKIRDQLRTIDSVRPISVTDLFGKRAKNPVTNKLVPILPANFVDPSSGTGVVMSVPAHAPYDYVAIQELIEQNQLERYGVMKEELEPITLVKSELGEAPARGVVESMNIASTKEIEKLDEVTSTVYKKEFHSGTLNENCSVYDGSIVSGVKDKIIVDFVEKGIADIFYDVKDVVCRCGTSCHVKILENQWFLKYSDADWKALVRKAIENMRIYPEEARNNFFATLDWMNDKACARKGGLGTLLPWDKAWIIETLSDSTIYMAYYTISHVIGKNKIKAEKLTHEVFDFVMLGKGSAISASKKSKIPTTLLKQMRDEFEYFYPVDFRNSAKDLVQNHLLFYLYHHAAFWQPDKWPAAVAVNGYVNVEGEKMSKSRGNIIPLSEAVSSYGADLVRINIAASAEGIDDADWRVENIKSYRNRLEYIHDLAKDIAKAKRNTQNSSDLYILSRMQKIARNAADSYETAKFRTAMNYALYETVNEIKWYLERTGGIKNANRKTLSDVLSTAIRLLAPVTPFLSEEIWSILGKRGFVSTAKWPVYDQSKVNDQIEMGEKLVRDAVEDVREIQKIKVMKPRLVKIYVADGWKFDVYNIVLSNKDKPVNDITKEIMSGDMKKYGSATVSFIQALYKKINEVSPILSKEAQMNAFADAKKFLENEIKCSVEIVDASHSNEQKARTAAPQRPGILLE